MEKTNFKKEFLKKFNSLCGTQSAWKVWADFVTASACSLANVTDRGVHYEDREKEYETCVKTLGGVENAAELFSYVVLALEENPEQDFLGSLFMELNLGSHWKGQFFTPYSICRMMSKVTMTNTVAIMEDKGWVSVNDPACGAGATLIAAVNEFKNKEIDYHNHALFVAQDIDRTTGLMCYIQLSLLGCAGYVVIGDTLCNPVIGKSALFPQENDGQEIWYMPMFASDVWQMRKKWNYIDLIFAEGVVKNA